MSDAAQTPLSELVDRALRLMASGELRLVLDSPKYTHSFGMEVPQEIARRAFPPPSPAGEGWQTVPKEPTEEMRIVGWELARIALADVDEAASHISPNVLKIWAAMLAAAPPPPGSEPSSELAAQHQAHLESWKAERDKSSSALAEAMEVIRPFAEFASLSGFDKLPPELPITNGSRLAAKQVTAADFTRARNFLASHSKGE